MDNNIYSKIDDYNHDTIDDHKSRLIMSTKILENSNQSLEKATRILNEAELIGIDTASKLREQGHRIRKMDDDLDSVNQKVRHGGRILGKMSRREIIIKITIICVILFLLIIIGVIISYMLYKLFGEQ